MKCSQCIFSDKEVEEIKIEEEEEGIVKCFSPKRLTKGFTFCYVSANRENFCCFGFSVKEAIELTNNIIIFSLLEQIHKESLRCPRPILYCFKKEYKKIKQRRYIGYDPERG